MVCFSVLWLGIVWCVCVWASERCEILWYALVWCGLVQYSVFVFEDKWDCECKSERCEILWCVCV